MSYGNVLKPFLTRLMAHKKGKEGGSSQGEGTQKKRRRAGLSVPPRAGGSPGEGPRSRSRTPQRHGSKGSIGSSVQRASRSPGYD